MRSDKDGRIGVGLRIGLVDAIDFSPSSLLLAEGKVAERCFSSKSLTSFAAGATDVSSLVAALGEGESNLAGERAAARVAAM